MGGFAGWWDLRDGGLCGMEENKKSAQPKKTMPIAHRAESGGRHAHASATHAVLSPL